MNPTFNITGDEASAECIRISLTRGRKKESRLTRTEFTALVNALVKDYAILSQIGSGNTISIEIDVSLELNSQKRSTEMPSLIVINGVRPLAVTKAEFFSVIRSPRIAQRALYWTRRGRPYVKIFREGGRGASLLLDTQSVEVFYDNLLSGENAPPSMPCET